MAAGLGFKEFTTGDVLTAADANGYLASQVVMVFASAAARTSAIASPQEGMISYLKDTDVVQTYSGSAWVSVGGAAGGKVLQVVYATTTTSTAVSTATYIDSTLTATITPTLATSKILVIFNQNLSKSNDIEGGLKLLRGATEILAYATSNLLYTASGLTLRGVPASATYLDSPATTSATTYKTQINATGSSLTAQLGNASSTITLLEIGA